MTGKEKTNLFTYATKELSQDAFLCWLFANYDCENGKVREVARALLTKFVNKPIGEITDCRILKQWNYLDICVRLDCGNITYLIAIEDKTYSDVHDDQLNRYYGDVNNYADKLRKDKDVECHYVFYKTAFVSEKERSGIDEKWAIYDIEAIYRFFSAYSNTENAILDDYIEYIVGIFDLLYNYKNFEFDKLLGNCRVFEHYAIDEIGKKAAKIGVGEPDTSIYQGKYVQTFLRKVTETGLIVELGIFFRERVFSAWVKCWICGTKHNVVNYDLRSEIVGKIAANKDKLIVFCNNAVYCNRVLRTEVNPMDFTDFSDFDNWINRCIQDYNTVINLLQEPIIIKTNKEDL